MKHSFLFVAALSVVASASAAAQPASPNPMPSGQRVIGADREGQGYVDGVAAPTYLGATPEIHTVRRGDTLWDLCWYYFSDPWQWPKVWSYNAQITNPHWIYPGDLVRLLPKGMFIETVTNPSVDPEGTGITTGPVDDRPAPTRRIGVGLRQTAFIEDAELKQGMTVVGSKEERELLSQGDSIYLTYDAAKPPTVGERYTIYAPEDTKVKRGGASIGSYVRLLGEAEVVSVLKDKRARAVITDASFEIERGARVGPLKRDLNMVAPTAAEVDLQGTIIAMLSRDQLIGDGEVVFIDQGKSSGLKPGNRMVVVRRGDAYDDELKPSSTVGQDDRRFPARALGEIMIIDVGGNISIGLVTLAVQEMGVGDLVMMQKAP